MGTPWYFMSGQLPRTSYWRKLNSYGFHPHYQQPKARKLYIEYPPRKTLTCTSSTSTLRNIKFGYFLLSSTKIGDITRHGPHQVAVKSTTICSRTRATAWHHSLVCKTFCDSTTKHFVKEKGLSLPAAAVEAGDGQLKGEWWTGKLQTKKERKSTHNFSSMFGLLNLVVPRNLFVHHMH